MNTKKTQEECRIWGVYVAAFVILFCLFWKLPWFSDDFEFADLARTKTFGEIANYILYYGNGRLLGNILSIAMVNANVAISAFVKATAVLGIIILLPRVLGIRSTGAFLVSFLLVMGVAPQIYAQVFIWTSGFVNFTFSVFLSLLCAYLVQTARQKTAIQKIVLAVFAVASQLFAEHVSIINILVAAGMVWYFGRKDIAKRDAALIWLAGCIIGAVTMLILPFMFYIEGNRTQGYREIHTDNILVVCKSIFNSVQQMLVTLSRCTLLVFVISCFGWAVHRRTQGLFSFFAKVVYLVFPVISFLFNVREGMWIPTFARYGAVYGGLLVYCLVLAIDVLWLANKEIKNSMLLLAFLAMASAAPFLIVTPFGERCLFVAYSFLVMFAIKGLYYAADLLQIRFLNNKWALSAFAILLSAFLCIETANIRKWNTERNEYIESCMADGATSICIYEIPSGYGFQTYLISRWYYYESWNDISYEIVEYEEWLMRITQ